MTNLIYTTKHVNTAEEYLAALDAGYRVVKLPEKKELFAVLKVRHRENAAYTVAYAKHLFLCSLARAEEYDKDVKDILAIVLPLAEGGDSGAQAAIAKYYNYADNIPNSLELAVQWLHKAAEQGDAIAQFSLAWHYHMGRGVSVSYEKAAEWYRKAAEQGYEEAQFNLGACYKWGHGVPFSWEQAAEWYRKAAEQGHSSAQYSLGCCYDAGNGVPQSREKANEWYRKSAAQGDEDAKKALRKRGR